MNHNVEEDERKRKLYDKMAAIRNGNSAKGKKIKTLEGEDLISTLPDEIIARILSFLPSIEEVVRTGILSKRWQSQWTSCPVLDFSNPKNRPISDFISFIDKTLNRRGRSKIEKLRLYFEYMSDHSTMASRLSCWISYAVECRVNELDFLFNCPDIFFDLPEHVYDSSYLTSLALSNCNFVTGVRVSWKSLRTLKIWSSKLSYELIHDMMAGSPVLETLELSSCYGFNRLDIDSPSVKKFILDGYFEPYKTEDDSVLEISAPNISSLVILNDMSLMSLKLVNMRSLMDACIDFYRYTDHLDMIVEDADENMLKDILHSLSHVNTLTVGEWAMEIISLLEKKGWNSPLSKRKCLKFERFIRRSAFPGLSNLLLSSPHLETLHINSGGHCATDPWSTHTDENYLMLVKRSFECLQSHLKTIEIAYYIEWDSESELVQFLLNNACVLEKMIITCGSKAAWTLLFAFKLLSFPRASTNAVVLCPRFMPVLE